MTRFHSRQVSRRERLFELLPRRSRFIFLSKLVIGALVIGLFGTMVILPMFQDDENGMRIAFSPSEGQGGDDKQPVMMNPKFQGVDDENQPYTVTAERARQVYDQDIVMEKLSADLTMNDQSWLSLSADDGLLKMKEQMLFLTGNVQMFRDDGYELKTEEMRVNIETGEAFGEKPIRGQGAMGSFLAQGFSIYDKGRRMVFTGRVTLTILNHAI